MVEREDPITCNECGAELPFAFEEQRDDIVCMTCVKGQND